MGWCSEYAAAIRDEVLIADSQVRLRGQMIGNQLAQNFGRSDGLKVSKRGAEKHEVKWSMSEF
jgi:hypothetical protein